MLAVAFVDKGWGDKGVQYEYGYEKEASPGQWRLSYYAALTVRKREMAKCKLGQLRCLRRFHRSRVARQALEQVAK